MMFVLLGQYVPLCIEMYKSGDHHGDNSLSDTGDCDTSDGEKSDGDNYIHIYWIK